MTAMLRWSEKDAQQYEWRPWSDREKDILTAYYRNTPHNIFSVAVIAKELGRSEDAVIIKAGRMKLSNPCRKASNTAKTAMAASQQKNCARPEERERRSVQASKWLKSNEHPRGFKGGSHTESAKKKIGEATAAAWRRPDYPQNSEQYRQQLSDRFTALPRDKKTYSRGNGGRREDLENRYFRSRWEANYARYLNFLVAQGELWKWEYEPETFWFESIKRGTRSYTPDFKVWKTEDATPYFDEVKGWMDARSKTKLTRMKRFYPHITVNLVTGAEYQQISKTVARLIPTWEKG